MLNVVFFGQKTVILQIVDKLCCW